MSNQSPIINFEVGKKYLTDSGDIAVCKKIFADESIIFLLDQVVRAFNKYGETFSNREKLTIISEYIEPKQENAPQLFDWTKPAQTRSGTKVKELLKFKDKTSKYPLVGILEGCIGNFSWTLEGKSSAHTASDLINIPEPKKIVPLGPEDIKPGDAIKAKNDKDTHKWGIVLSVSAYINGLYYLTTSFGSISLVALVSNYLISHDNGATWEECFKEG